VVVGGAVEVSGRTAPGASVRAGDAVLVADPTGLFKGTAKVSKDLEVRAYGPKLAPRAIVVPIAKAETLEDAAKGLKAQAKSPFDAIAAKPDEHVGANVAVVFEVVQVGEVDGRPLAVGETRCKAAAGCPMVKVLLPPGATVKAAEVHEVLGRVVRGVSIEQGKSTAVEIDAAIVLPAK
jgi:hypothetical protein